MKTKWIVKVGYLHFVGKRAVMSNRAYCFNTRRRASDFLFAMQGRGDIFVQSPVKVKT